MRRTSSDLGNLQDSAVLDRARLLCTFVRFVFSMDYLGIPRIAIIPNVLKNSLVQSGQSQRIAPFVALLSRCLSASGTLNRRKPSPRWLLSLISTRTFSPAITTFEAKPPSRFPHIAITSPDDASRHSRSKWPLRVTAARPKVLKNAKLVNSSVAHSRLPVATLKASARPCARSNTFSPSCSSPLYAPNSFGRSARHSSRSVSCSRHWIWYVGPKLTTQTASPNADSAAVFSPVLTRVGAWVGSSNTRSGPL